MPIHVGTSAPLLVPERQTHAYQSEALTGQWPHQTFDKCNTAIDFLRNTIRTHPGEITLLTIGPLTNIALLFALDPDIPVLLKGLVMMGGCFSAKHNDAEWNILCDPHAAAKVFAAPLDLTSVGFDVTSQCRLEADECRRRFRQAGGPLAFVAVMAEVFFRYGSPEIIFHDPLAAALIFDPSLCQTRAQRIEVDLVNEGTLGRTRPVDEAVSRPHHVAYSVKAAEFFEHYSKPPRPKGGALTTPTPKIFCYPMKQLAHIRSKVTSQNPFPVLRCPYQRILAIIDCVTGPSESHRMPPESICVSVV